MYTRLYPFKDAHDADWDKPICEHYQVSRLQATVLNNVVKYTIIILNTVIRWIVIAIVQRVG